jgi:hypothetical protein
LAKIIREINSFCARLSRATRHGMMVPGAGMSQALLCC